MKIVRGASFFIFCGTRNEWKGISDGGDLYPSEAHGGWVGWVLARRDANHRSALKLDPVRCSPDYFLGNVNLEDSKQQGKLKSHLVNSQ